MTYYEMKQKTFNHATIKDGYNGHTLDIELAFEDGILYGIAEFGYFTIYGPDRIFTSKRNVLTTVYEDKRFISIGGKKV